MGNNNFNFTNMGMNNGFGCKKNCECNACDLAQEMADDLVDSGIGFDEARNLPDLVEGCEYDCGECCLCKTANSNRTDDGS